MLMLLMGVLAALIGGSAALSRNDARTLLARALEGADAGELFLEYRQSEMLHFDNGRLKQATYDTTQGFGLRAIKDEAVGYAHASDVSEAAIARELTHAHGGDLTLVSSDAAGTLFRIDLPARRAAV